MENNKLIELLNEFLVKTRERKIPWNLVNPNAVRWTKTATPQPTIVTLQRQTTTVASPGLQNSVREIYVFTVQTPPTVSIQINTTVDQYLTPILGSLFKEALISANDKTLATLQNLLEGL